MKLNKDVLTELIESATLTEQQKQRLGTLILLRAGLTRNGYERGKADKSVRAVAHANGPAGRRHP